MNSNAPKQVSPTLTASGIRFAFVVSRYNSLVTKELLAGGLDVIERHGGDPSEQLVVWAPGAFELPLLVKSVFDNTDVDGVIALGCVMTGATTHNEYIAAEVAKGCGALSLQYGKPVSFGVLTPDTLEQALERAGMKAGNKGAEATMAALEVVLSQRELAKLTKRAKR